MHHTMRDFAVQAMLLVKYRGQAADCDGSCTELDYYASSLLLVQQPQGRRK